MDVIETERLRLERWSPAHYEPYARMSADPQVMRFIRDGSTFGAERASAVHEQKLRHWEERGFGWRAALARTDGSWVGLVALQPVGVGTVGVAPDEIEIGWWVEPALWGRGYGTEAALALLDEGFGRVGLDRLIARIQPGNEASARIALKLGMRHDRVTQGEYSEAIDIYVLDRPA